MNKREAVIQNIVQTITAIPIFTGKVGRKKLGFDDFTSIPETLLPYTSVTAGLPEPKEIKYYNAKYGKIDKIISDLSVFVTVIGRDNVTPDETISLVVNTLWAALFADYTRGSLALSTLINPTAKTGIWDPYYAFELEVIVRYIHDTNNI